jgi:hypothetical protein
MKDSHQHHRGRVGGLSRRSPASLDEFAVPQVEQVEIVPIIASTRADIVV